MVDTSKYPGLYAVADLPQQAPIVSISTGWHELDRVFKLYAGQFVVVTGKVGHGKSTFLFNLMTNIARLHGMRSFAYVPENEGHAYDKLKRLFADDADGFEYFIHEQCFIQSCRHAYNDNSPRTLQRMLMKAAAAIEELKFELVLIDPFNYLERAKPRDQLMSDNINETLHDMAEFARYFNVIAILVAHPTKSAINNDIIGLYDIDGSAAFANKPDNGLCVARQKDGTSRVVSTKVRECPAAGDLAACNFWVDKETGKFTPMVGSASNFAGEQ